MKKQATSKKKNFDADIAKRPVEIIARSGSEFKTGSVTLHSRAGEKIKKNIGEMKEDYDLIVNNIAYIISDTDSKVAASGFKLDEITISLGVSASGKIAFIAEAGIEASIQVTFKR